MCIYLKGNTKNLTPSVYRLDGLTADFFNRHMSFPIEKKKRTATTSKHNMSYSLFCQDGKQQVNRPSVRVHQNPGGDQSYNFLTGEPIKPHVPYGSEKKNVVQENVSTQQASSSAPISKGTATDKNIADLSSHVQEIQNILSSLY